MKYVCLVLCFITTIAFSQPLQQPSSSQISLKLRKLNFLGSVLYMAAHPDDENTRLITYFANGRLATAGYLSMTRGDGGQNLIGPEIRDLLGVIRTQELLAARRIDGGQQYFTRANDFGFSKSADETFRVWGKDEVLSDVLKVWRQYQPDVVITRFPPDERAGHGHHTASAVLAHEAFDVSGKSDVYPEQVKEFGTWQPKRLYTNTGRWWNREINEKTPGIISIDVGGYNALLGRSYTEIATMSGSQHKSQGWGQTGLRGYFAEFLEHQKGEKAEKDIFEGVNTTWSRVKGGEKVQVLVDKAIREFDHANPAASVANLLNIRKEISKLEPGVWKTRKLQETEQLIQDCLGLFLEATASYHQGSPGQKVRVVMEVVNRAGGDITLNSISAPAISYDSTLSKKLEANVKLPVVTRQVFSNDLSFSDPHWLQESHGVGLFTVRDKTRIGLPQNPPAVDVTFSLTVAGETLEVKKPLIYKWTDPIKGELWRPFEIVPPIFINLSEKVLVFNSGEPKQLRLLLISSSNAKSSGIVRLQLPEGWRSEPASATFEMNKAGEELSRTFTIYPSSKESVGVIKALAELDGKTYDNSVQYIDYDHIPVQTLLPPAQANVARLDLRKEGKLIAYVRGAGDETPAALRNMGYEVWEMKNEEVTLENLKKTDGVVMGVRAVNTNPRIRYFMADLLNYVNEGGTLVMQYNTNFDFEVETFSPFNLKLSRDRVTEEDSEVRILKPEHTALNYPNKITQADFAGWVQERGLYFPNQWDPAFEALLSINDKGETPKDGSLLVAKYGSGHYVYTGLSFFRELPEGVPGAYRLFANLISLGKTSKVEPQQKAKNKRTK